MLTSNPTAPTHGDAPDTRTRIQRLLARARPSQILLVEDHDEPRALLANALRRDGYAVVG